MRSEALRIAKHTRNWIFVVSLFLSSLAFGYGQTGKSSGDYGARSKGSVSSHTPHSAVSPHASSGRVPHHAAIDPPIAKRSNPTQELNRLEHSNLGGAHGPALKGHAAPLQNGRAIPTNSTKSARNSSVNFTYHEPKGGLVTKGGSGNGRHVR